MTTDKNSSSNQPICRTCGGTPGHHVPSLLDPNGVGDPGHKVPGHNMTKNSQKDTTGPVGVAQNDKGTSTTVFFNTTDTAGAAQDSSQDYELQYCPIHGTMTNHLNGVCQKAPDVPGDHEARDSSQGDADLRETLANNLCSLPDGFRFADDDYTRVEDAIMEIVQAEVRRVRLDELRRACENWEKNPTLPATYMINRRAELKAGSGEGGNHE